jgi:NitT/TauT family transport system substrate-binding protein
VTSIAAGVVALAVGASGAAQADTKVKIGFTPTAEGLALLVAADQGFFKNHGIDAEPQLLRSTSVIVPGMVSGDIQIGALTAPIVLLAVDSGLPVKWLTGLAEYTPDSKGVAIVAREGSGVKTPADLVGRKFLTGNINSITTIIANQWLRNEGIDKGKIKFVEVSMAQVPDVLASGQADVGLSPDPMLSKILDAKTGYVLTYVGQIVPDKTASIVAAIASEWADKNPEAVPGIVAAIQEATDWSNAHKEEALKIAAKYLQVDVGVLERSEFPPLDANVTDTQVKWWIDALNADKLLRTDVKPEQALYK